MKEAKRYGEVSAVMPAGSHEQLLRFLENLEVKCEFFNRHADGKPAVSIKRKLERHWNKIRCELALLRFLNKFDLKETVVHTELAPWQSMLALLWLSRKTTVFMTMHNSLPPVPKWRFLVIKLKFQILARAKNFHLFTANHDTKNSLKPFVPNEFLETVKVIYANVNPEEIKAASSAEINRDEFIERYNLPKNKFLVFCVGQFIDRKGRWIFLEAARELKKINQDIAFVWISNYHPTAEELARADGYGLGDDFRFITSEQVGAEHIDLFKLMQMADIFALPSYVEGLPISIIEALALGIPTISTNINAIPEAVINMQTGLLIEPGNSDALRDAIQRLKDDRALSDNLAMRGREHALNNFDERAVARIAVDSYIEAYRQNIKNGR